MKTSLFRSIITTALLGIAAAGSLGAMNGGNDDIPWEKQSKKAAQTQPHCAEHQKHDRRQQHSTAQPSSSSASACSSANATPTPLRGMDLGVGLGTGIAANIDTDEQKAIQPASTSSSSTATANDSSSSTSTRLHDSARKIIFEDPQSPILDCIASFLVGSNSTDPAQMVAAFFKPAAIFQQNRRDDFFNFQRVNKAVYRSLRPMVQKIHKILFESGGEALGKLLLSMSKQRIYPATKIIIGNLEHINLDEPACRNLLMPMVQQGVRPAVKIIIGNLQRLNIPIDNIMDADGNNALHLASQRGDVGMRDLILAADQALDEQQNIANQTPYYQCSSGTKIRLHAKKVLSDGVTIGLSGTAICFLLLVNLAPANLLCPMSVIMGLLCGLCCSMVDVVALNTVAHPGASAAQARASILNRNQLMEMIGIMLIVVIAIRIIRAVSPPGS